MSCPPETPAWPEIRDWVPDWQANVTKLFRHALPEIPKGPQTIRRMAPKLAVGPPVGFDEQMFGAK
jgi:hypothetical protein